MIAICLIVGMSACKKESLADPSFVGRWRNHMMRFQETYQGVTVEERFDTEVNVLWKFRDEHRGEIGKDPDYAGVTWFYDQEHEQLGIGYQESWAVTYYQVRWESTDRVVLTRTIVNGADSARVTLEESYLKR